MRVFQGKWILAWLMIAVGIVGLGLWIADRRTDPAGEVGVRPQPTTEAAGVPMLPDLELELASAPRQQAARERSVRRGHPAHAEDAGSPHYRSRQEPVAAGDMDLLLVLRRGARLEGRVVDETGQVPSVARVQVVRVSENGADRASTQKASREGVFKFDDLLPGRYEVAATFGASLGAAQRVEVPQLDADLVLVAPRGARIEGHVLAAGSPVEGASVKLTWSSGAQRVFLDGELRKEVLTDATGRFEIGAVLAGEHVLEARHATLGRGTAHLPRVASGDEVQGLILELVAPGWIKGRISHAIDRRAGRTIQVMSRDRFDFASATTDADGRFTVQELRPGAYDVCLLMEGSNQLYDAVASATVLPGGGAQVVLSGEARAARIRGLVTAEARPVAGMEVWAYLMSGTEGFESDARTDARGAFELELPEGGYVAFVFGEVESGPGEEHFVPDGQTSALHFELPVGVVAGQVLDHAGRPAADAVVRLSSERRSKVQQCQADSEGRFEFQHVAPDRHMLSAGGTRLFAAGFTRQPPPPGGRAYGFERGEPFDLSAGERRTDILLVLPAPATVRGRLRLPPGSSQSELWLVATPGTSGSEWPAARAEIAGDRYQLQGLGSGLYEIEAIAYGARPSQVLRQVTLSEGQVLVLDLELE